MSQLLFFVAQHPFLMVLSAFLALIIGETLVRCFVALRRR